MEAGFLAGNSGGVVNFYQEFSSQKNWLIPLLMKEDNKLVNFPKRALNQIFSTRI